MDGQVAVIQQEYWEGMRLIEHCRQSINDYTQQIGIYIIRLNLIFKLTLERCERMATDYNEMFQRREQMDRQQTWMSGRAYNQMNSAIIRGADALMSYGNSANADLLFQHAADKQW